MPPLTGAETAQVVQETRQFFNGWARTNWNWDPTAAKDLERVIVDSCHDRTVVVEMEDLSLVNLAFLEAIRSGLLKQHPLWRVFFKGISPETVMLVYPGRIWIGAISDPEHLPQAFFNTQRAVTQQYRMKMAPINAQRAYAERALRKLIDTGEPPRFAVLAMFDQDLRLEPNRFGLWLLYKCDAIDWAEIVTNSDELFFVNSFTADRPGRILQIGEPAVKRICPYWNCDAVSSPASLIGKTIEIELGDHDGIIHWYVDPNELVSMNKLMKQSNTD